MYSGSFLTSIDWKNSSFVVKIYLFPLFSSINFDNKTVWLALEISILSIKKTILPLSISSFTFSFLIVASSNIFFITKYTAAFVNLSDFLGKLRISICTGMISNSLYLSIYFKPICCNMVVFPLSFFPKRITLSVSSNNSSKQTVSTFPELSETYSDSSDKIGSTKTSSISSGE